VSSVATAVEQYDVRDEGEEEQLELLGQLDHAAALLLAFTLSAKGASAGGNHGIGLPCTR
jgi:hypothetical protein